MRYGEATWLGILAGLLLGARAMAAEISVTVDPNPVRAGEAFALTFQAEAVDDDPDFSPLDQDFEVLSTSRSSHISVTDSRFSKTTRWSLHLLPRRSGDLVIPAITFGDDVTAPVPVKVIDTPATTFGDDLFVESTATPENPYVQAQVIYTLRLYYDPRLDIDEASVTDPRAGHGDAIIVRTGKDRELEREHGGRIYKVFERSFAIFPQRPGTLALNPVTIDIRYARGTRSLLDPFGHDLKRRRLTGADLRLDVRPVPAAFTGAHWLPAAAMELHETWSEEGAIEAGEPVARTVALLATGLTAGQLPELMPTAPDALKHYPAQPLLDDQRKASGITGLRQEQHTVIARGAGDTVFPAIAIPWWNTVSDRMEIASLPVRVLRARTAAVTPDVSARAPVPADVVPPAAPRPVAPPGPVTKDYWSWLGPLLGAGWAVTLLGWAWSSRRRFRPAGIRSRKAALDIAARRILAVCKRGDAQSVSQALLAWAALRWPDDPPRSLGNLGKRLPAIEHLLRGVETARYGRDAGTWDAKGLALAFARLGTATHAKPLPAAPGLQPLYRSIGDAAGV
jgi:hypothetical protein